MKQVVQSAPAASPQARLPVLRPNRADEIAREINAGALDNAPSDSQPNAAARRRQPETDVLYGLVMVGGLLGALAGFIGFLSAKQLKVSPFHFGAGVALAMFCTVMLFTPNRVLRDNFVVSIIGTRNPWVARTALLVVGLLSWFAVVTALTSK